MADPRFVGQGIRRRMGAEMSTLAMTEPQERCTHCGTGIRLSVHHDTSGLPRSGVEVSPDRRWEHTGPPPSTGYWGHVAWPERSD